MVSDRLEHDFLSEWLYFSADGPKDPGNRVETTHKHTARKHQISAQMSPVKKKKESDKRDVKIKSLIYYNRQS